MVEGLSGVHSPHLGVVHAGWPCGWKKTIIVAAAVALGEVMMKSV